MKALLFIPFFISLISYSQSTVLSGKIILDNDTDVVPGTAIRLKGSSIEVSSDVEGKFQIQIPKGQKSATLLISFPAMVNIELSNIEVGDSQLVNLENIQLFTNKFLTPYEFKTLKNKEKKNYYELKCWANLLGYIAINQAEREELVIPCKQDSAKSYLPTYNSATNTLLIDYKKLKECR